MTTFSRQSEVGRLAIDGGTRAVVGSLPPMYPGGMRIGVEEEALVLEVLRSKRLFRYYGPGAADSKVEQFEHLASRKLGATHALAVSSGSMALASALAALGVGPGDEVIVPAYTWISSAAAVVLVGAVPVIAEVDEALTLDAADAESRITERTKVLLVVHMRGAPSNMDALVNLASRRGLRILEDTAQAFGGSYHGQHLGTIGDIGIFSLQFNKILTAGEGGLVTTDDRRLYERALMFHDVAGSQRATLIENKTFVGTTGRMSELQGAVAVAQLAKLDGILSDMRANYSAIKSRVSEVADEAGITWRKQWDSNGDTGLALIAYLPKPEQADEVVAALQAEGVDAGRLFDPNVSDYHVAYHWNPLISARSWADVTPWDHNSNAKKLDPSTCPKTHALLARAIQVDVSPELTEAQVDQVSTALRKVFSSMPVA